MHKALLTPEKEVEDTSSAAMSDCLGPHARPRAGNARSLWTAEAPTISCCNRDGGEIRAGDDCKHPSPYKLIVVAEGTSGDVSLNNV